MFGNAGLKIFTADGSKILKHLPAKEVCPLDSQGEASCRSFSELVSDEQNYIWTTSDSRSGYQVEVFDLKTGELAGILPTCQAPRGLTYLPSRQEVWFRCTSIHPTDPDGESGHWDSFSTTSIGANFPEVKLFSNLPNFNETRWGTAAFDSNTGIGYSSDYSNNVIHKVDLSTRTPLEAIQLEETLNGSWDMVYSPMNQHLYAKTYVRCTCGGPDKDLDEMFSTVAQSTSSSKPDRTPILSTNRWEHADVVATTPSLTLSESSRSTRQRMQSSDTTKIRSDLVPPPSESLPISPRLCFPVPQRQNPPTFASSLLV